MAESNDGFVAVVKELQVTWLILSSPVFGGGAPSYGAEGVMCRRPIRYDPLRPSATSPAFAGEESRA
jgi:hypothetical protein